MTTDPKAALSIIDAMAGDLDMSAKELTNALKATVLPPGATLGQAYAFLAVCREHHLNPFLKQIHCFVDRDGVVRPMVGVDGWSAIANGHKQMDGVDFEFEWQADSSKPFSCTTKIYRKDRSHPVVVTEFYHECVRPRSKPWQEMPARMLRNRCFAQAVRMAFGVSGIQDEDEVTATLENVEARVKASTPTAPPSGLSELIAQRSETSAGTTIEEVSDAVATLTTRDREATAVMAADAADQAQRELEAEWGRAEDQRAEEPQGDEGPLRKHLFGDDDGEVESVEDPG